MVSALLIDFKKIGQYALSGNDGERCQYRLDEYCADLEQPFDFANKLFVDQK